MYCNTEINAMKNGETNCKQTFCFEYHKNYARKLQNLPEHHRGAQFLSVAVALELLVFFSAFPT